MSLPRTNLKWDPKSVEIRTKSVEKTLEPLVRHVTTLVNHHIRKPRRGYCSLKAMQLVKEIQIATQRLIEVGESIAEDFIEMKEPMLAACAEARDAGDTMQETSLEFAEDPANPQKRSLMVRAARALLSAVTRLLCVADMADVRKLLQQIEVVNDHLNYLVNIDDLDEMTTSFKDYGDVVMDLLRQSGQRQADLKNQCYKDEMAAARASLKNASKLFYTSSKACITHPNAISALGNRDFSVNELNDALSTIARVVQAYGEGTQHPFERRGSLSSLFDELINQLDRDPSDFIQKRLQNDIRSLVDDVVDGCRQAADTVASTNSIKEKIYDGCRKVKEAQSNLLDSCSDKDKGTTADVETARTHMDEVTRDLAKQVKGCVIGSVADSFLGTNVPLTLLIEAAEAGDREEADARSVIFLDHTEKLAEVANLACTMSDNAEGIKMVKIAAQQLQDISQEVAHSAKTTAKHPRSKAALDNMHAFRDAWLQQMAILTEAVDDITSIDDYLTICEQRVLEDTNRCVDAMQHQDIPEVSRTADAIRERIQRVDEVVTAEMENHEPGEYKENVEKCLKKIKTYDLSHFLDHIDKVVQSADGSDIDEKAFEESSIKVYQSFRDLRKSVKRRRPGDESDTEDEAGEDDEVWLQDDEVDATQADTVPKPDYFLHSARTASSLMRSLTNEQKMKINTLAEGLDGDKDRLLSEVSKWEEQGNEIIVIAKKMCMIMMDLSDFTRGKGELKNSIDVIKACEKIAKYGSKLSDLVRQVAESCPHSITKSDLMAYIQRIALYAHQLTMTARVKADVHMIRGEAILGIETVKSLIETARNLMNSVMLTVRASYIASTKHKSECMTSSVNWRMRPADKKPLIESNDYNRMSQSDGFGINF